MLLPSTGFTCGTFCSNDAMFTKGTMMTVPEISAGLSSWMSFSSAMMDAYSGPCAPATRARVGPGFGPRMTATGIFVPTSLPAETSMNPVTVCPVTAAAVPTVNVGCCAVPATHRKQLRRINAKSLRILASSRPRFDSRRSITPPVESYTGPAALATNLRPRLARDKRQHPNRRIQDDFLELDFWPACAEPRRREARYFLIGLLPRSP